MASEELTVAPGTRLLHIGPHKTGTTAIQGAFHQARNGLAAHDVVYAGKGRQPQHAAAAITGVNIVKGVGTPTLEHWEALRTEVKRAGNQRVVISSEYFSNADDEAARTVVEGLGGSRVHVVVTLRPLLKIMPSQWQQYIQNGLRVSYENWLDGMLRKPPYSKPTPTFWKRHRHDKIVERWAEVVGRENLTVIVVDDADPLMQLRVFEQLIGLPDGFLELEDGRSNRSLTLGEVELILQLNKELGKRKWPDDLYGQVMRDGVMRRMRKVHEPSRDEARITTPEWAATEAAVLSKEMASKISTMGVRIIGDLSSLSKPSSSNPDQAAQPMVPSTAAAGAVLGGVLASLSAAPPATPAAKAATSAARTTPSEPSMPEPNLVEDRRIRDADARTLLRVLWQRGVQRFRR